MSHAIRLASRCAVVLAVASVSTAARADDNEQHAEALFRSGETKFDSGEVAAACADFEVSLRMGPKLGTLLNLALCHETLGRLATAWSEYNHASAWASQNGQRERRDFAMQHVVSLEPRLPRVSFHLPVDRAFASVEIDGEPVSVPRAFLPQYLDPGEHTVAVTAPGKKRSSTTFRVVISGSEQIVIVPSLLDLPAPIVVRPKVVALNTHATRRWIGWSAIGVGGAGLIVGSVFGGMAIRDRDQATSHCRGTACDVEGAFHYRESQDSARISTVAFALGLGAAAAGAVLVLVSKDTRVAVGPGILRGTF